MSNSSLVNGYSDLRNSRKRSTMRQAISQYIKPIKHSQQMQILEPVSYTHLSTGLLSSASYTMPDGSMITFDPMP